MKPVSIVKQKALGCGIACLVSACIDHGIQVDHDRIVGGVLKHVLGQGGDLEGAFLPHLLAGFVLSLGLANHFDMGIGENYIKDSEPFIQDTCAILFYKSGHYVRLASVVKDDIRVMCPSQGDIVPIDRNYIANTLVFRCRKIGNDLIRLI